MREILFDTETTGLDPISGHRIVEIGCVEMVHKLRTNNVFHRYINPMRDMPSQAEAIHGISSEFLQDKPIFADIVDELVAFIGDDAILVAHNASFDMKFINHELKSHGHYAICNSRVIDTLAMARTKFPGSPASLDALCRRFDVDLSRRDKHGALLDAELLAEVYIELCGGKQVGIDFTQPDQSAAVAAIDRAASYKHLQMRVTPIQPEELDAHQALVGSIQNALWNEYKVS